MIRFAMVERFQSALYPIRARYYGCGSVPNWFIAFASIQSYRLMSTFVLITASIRTPTIVFGRIWVFILILHNSGYHGSVPMAMLTYYQFISILVTQ